MTDVGLNRRRALRTLATGVMGAATSSIWVESLSALARQHAHTQAAQAAIAAQDWTPGVLSAQQNELVVTLTELIIPETDTPGAKAVRVNRFIDGVLKEAPAAERESFLRGLTWLDARSKALFKTDFLGASPSQQTTLLTRLSSDGNPDKEDRIGREFFQAIKSITIDGYYTTEVGLRRELGDNGQLFLPQFQGCDHAEHGGKGP
ncbi:MAG: gluconate 2-dehydrogenase subunit 3 family protein [Vicinamibacterales bacterium]